jgi:Ferritin-like domain
MDDQNRAPIFVEVVDEAVGSDPGRSRSDFLERAVVGGATLVAGGLLVAGLPRLAASAPSPEQDVATLNFALLLEGLQSAFYAAALDKAGLSGELRQFAETVGGHERLHLEFLRKTLGGEARPLPSFDLGNSVTSPAKFRVAAAALEEIGVAAYNGQATNLTPATLAQAARIVSVEARHASWARGLAGQDPAPRASDPAIGERQARAALRRRGLIS